MPFFYGLFSIMFAVFLGVGAAFIRRFISDFQKKRLMKSELKKVIYNSIDRLVYE
jgi:hypothetical protein